MNCSECTTQISEYLDGELPDIKYRLVKKHLQSCPSCQALAEVSYADYLGNRASI